jgi:hypothetical protein
MAAALVSNASRLRAIPALWMAPESAMLFTSPCSTGMVTGMMSRIMSSHFPSNATHITRFAFTRASDSHELLEVTGIRTFAARSYRKTSWLSR